MLSRIITVASLATLLWAGAAWAAPVTVQLRVEGSSATIFEGPITTDGKTIDKGDGPHPCDGTSASPPQPPGPTMTSALDDASIVAGFTWEGTWFSFGDFFVTKIGPDPGSETAYWGTVLNYQPTAVGGCQQQVSNGDEVLFAYGDVYSEPLLRLAGPAKGELGHDLTVTVRDGKDGSPVSGATVGGTITGADGTATLDFDSAGVKRLKAQKPGTIRSNALEICVAAAGVAGCAAATRPSPAPGAAPAPGALSKGARDSKAPVARISSPRDGSRYRRGPRLLRGFASDDESGLGEVKLALRRHVRGRNCRWWSGRRERFVGHHCHKIFFFAIGDSPSWSYLLPRALPRGRYVLDVKAFDRARNRDERFVRGGNRVVFDVVGRRAAAAITRAARVQVMVVGTDRVLASAQSLRAHTSLVRASGRRCLVRASTPLAALGARLATAGVSYHVRDFGRCSSRSSRSSAQLFVDRIGDDRNSGQDGWFYKVDDRAGTAGAADPAGIPGRALRAGARVLWFYCRFDERSGSCQRSLEAVPARRALPVGESLGVSVRGHDNEGRSTPVPGATVSLGALSAQTDPRGNVAFSAPPPGRYLLRASKAGAVPAFPVPVTVSRAYR